MRRRAVVMAVLAAAAAAVHASSALGGTDQAPRRQTITMREFRFVGVPSNLRSGRTTFTFRNTGQNPHNFTVVAALGGGRIFRSATVAPGNSQRKTVNLRAGTYLAICTVGNGFHLERGMLKVFTVGRSG
jgi:plastocyanin